MNMAKWMGKRPQGLNPTKNTVDDRGKLGVEEVVLPREEHTNWLSTDKNSSLKAYMKVTLNEFNRLYLGVHTCMQIYAYMQ